MESLYRVSRKNKKCFETPCISDFSEDVGSLFMKNIFLNFLNFEFRSESWIWICQLSSCWRRHKSHSNIKWFAPPKQNNQGEKWFFFTILTVLTVLTKIVHTAIGVDNTLKMWKRNSSAVSLNHQKLYQESIEVLIWSDFR